MPETFYPWDLNTISCRLSFIPHPLQLLRSRLSCWKLGMSNEQPLSTSPRPEGSWPSLWSCSLGATFQPSACEPVVWAVAQPMEFYT